jgi:hypothetical protein
MIELLVFAHVALFLVLVWFQQFVVGIIFTSSVVCVACLGFNGSLEGTPGLALFVSTRLFATTPSSHTYIFK